MQTTHEPKALFEDGCLFTLEEFERRWPNSPILPQFRELVKAYRANAEAIEAEYAAKERYDSWKNVSLEDLCHNGSNLCDKLLKVYYLYEGYDNRKAKEIDGLLVEGHNAVGNGYCLKNGYCLTTPEDVRNRIIDFIETSTKFLSKN